MRTEGRTEQQGCKWDSKVCRTTGTSENICAHSFSSAIFLYVKGTKPGVRIAMHVKGSPFIQVSTLGYCIGLSRLISTTVSLGFIHALFPGYIFLDLQENTSNPGSMLDTKTGKYWNTA
jgi:hypothetical protein